MPPRGEDDTNDLDDVVADAGVDFEGSSKVIRSDVDRTLERTWQAKTSVSGRASWAGVVVGGGGGGGLYDAAKSASARADRRARRTALSECRRLMAASRSELTV